ncbi:glucokinase, partial [Citrobacter freundii]|uniref:glucokinase n=1 Tax=Citrobacter freundii TaxID=546 RepID=UPI001F494927
CHPVASNRTGNGNAAIFDADAMLIQVHAHHGFRGGFEDKGRFKAYVQDIPVYLIVHDNPGLLGAGAHLRQTLGHIL